MNRRRRWRGARLRRGSERLYRALLWLYPPSLRRGYGGNMQQLFRDSLRAEIQCAGRAGLLRAWRVTLADLVASLAREWPRELQRRRSPQRRMSAPMILSGQWIGYTIVAQYAETGQGMNADKFEKFTERARKVLSLAQEEAQRFNHNYIGTEHLLLGLVREGDGVAAKVLSSLGVELNKVRSAVEFIIGRGDRVVLGELGLTPRAKKVIELAVDEARRLNHHYIGTEHILLGMVREGEGIAAGVLESLGVNLEKVRKSTVMVLNNPTAFPSGYTDRSARASRPYVWDELGMFSVRARRTIAGAITEARERGQREVGTGHVLLALLDDPESVAMRTLNLAGISPDETRQALEHDIGPRKSKADQPAMGPVELDSHVLRMVALAADEAYQLKHPFIGAEHLLLGIIREEQGLGARVLLSLNADLNWIRAQSLQALAQTGGAIDRRPALGQISLLCHEVAMTAEFYVKRFDAAPTAGSGATDAEEQTLRLPGGGPLLALRPIPPGSGRAGAPTIELDIWVDNLDLTWSALKDTEVADLSPVSESPRGRFFTLPDPDGRLLHVYALSEQENA